MKCKNSKYNYDGTVSNEDLTFVLLIIDQFPHFKFMAKFIDSEIFLIFLESFLLIFIHFGQEKNSTNKMSKHKHI